MFKWDNLKVVANFINHIAFGFTLCDADKTLRNIEVICGS